MDTAATDLNLNMTSEFLLQTVIVPKDEEKQPFITRNGPNNTHSKKKQSLYQKHRVDLLRVRVPLLILAYAYYALFVVIPYLPIADLYIALYYIPSIFLLCVNYWTFYVGAYSHPGRIPKEWLLWNGDDNNKPSIPIYSKILDSKIISSGYTINPNDIAKLFCKKCNKYRPLRSHHCSRCGICIARMDHHCNILSNCVGINNHRYFTQFLCWIFIICLDYEITFCFSCKYIQENESYLIYIGATFMWYLGFPILMWLSVMIFTNFKYIFNNDTLLELKFKISHITKYGYAKEDYQPFDLGEKCKNFKVVCGTSVIRWFFPLKWTKSDLEKRMMTDSYTFDICCWNRDF